MYFFLINEDTIIVSERECRRKGVGSVKDITTSCNQRQT